MGFEPTTTTLATWCSTPELLPPVGLATIEDDEKMSPSRMNGRPRSKSQYRETERECKSVLLKNPPGRAVHLTKWFALAVWTGYLKKSAVPRSPGVSRRQTAWFAVKGPLIMGFQLVVVQGRSANQALKIGTGVMTVGRQQDCQLRIASSQVSRKHCQLFEKKGLLLVKDLGSANGTLVNGKRIADQRVLEHGDELTVGSVKFRVERTEDTVMMPGTGHPASEGAKPGDTAIAQPISGEDDLIELEDQEPTGVQTTTKANAPHPSSPAGAARSPTAAQSARTEEVVVEISDDAVADYLLNIELDDEDKV